MLNNISKTEKILLIVLCAAFILFIYVRFLFTPAINSLSNEKRIINDCKKQVEHINDIKVKNKELNTKLDGLQSKMNESINSLPFNERTPEIERITKTMEDNAQLNFSQMTFGQPATPQITSNVQTNTSGSQTSSTGNQQSSTQQAKGGTNKSTVTLMEQPMGLNCTGEFNNIIKLLDDIEKDKRFAQVDSVNLAQEGNSVRAIISVQYYFVNSTKQQDIQYDFNTGKYGKDDWFK